MPPKVNLLQKLIAILFISLSFVLLLGRSHFLIGSALYTGRWVLVLFMLWLMYSLSKRSNHTKIYRILLLSTSLLIGEAVWNYARQYRFFADTMGKKVSVMTYNVYFKNQSPVLAIAQIKKAKPDILVIQELTPAWNNHLAGSIEPSYPYRKKIVLKGTHGIGIYSKYPIAQTESLLNSSRLPYAQISSIKVGGKNIQLFNTHTASPAKAVENPERFFEFYQSVYEIRRKQLATISERAVKDAKKFHAQILIGDLNTPSQEPLFRDLLYCWSNIAPIGWHPNFPNSSKIPPMLSLDYIMLRGNAEGLGFRVLEGGSSDHLAVFGEVEL